MKIPETSANVGVYYGNEENSQWQPNGVLIDTGVGGGVVGSGDAGALRPPLYPHMHMPRPHIPAGYVMAGAYYPPAAYPVPAPQDDFEDYMWMENEEEFDKQVMQQLEEEALMEQCIEAMLEDEQRERRVNGSAQCAGTNNGNPLSLEETVSRSTLNPLAAEFVPTRAPAVHTTPPQPNAAVEKSEARQEVPPATGVRARGELAGGAAREEKAEVAEVRTEVTESAPEATPAEVTPEVSAAEADKRPKEARKETKRDTKKVAAKVVDTKPKAKPQPAKSEPKLVAKKEPRAQTEVSDDTTPAVEFPKPQVPPTEDTTPVSTGPKPINYAAAARAAKPKRTAPAPAPTIAPTTAPALTKTDKKLPEKTDRKDKSKSEKIAPKSDKPIQRKNSAK